MLQGITEMTEWLNTLRKDAPEVGSLTSPSDLARLSRKYQALKDRVDKKQDPFRLLNDKGNELLLLHQSNDLNSFNKLHKNHQLSVYLNT